VYKPEGRRIFLNCDVRKPMDWQRVRKWMTVQRGLVVRGYVINDELLWKKSEKTGLNILATDKVCKYPWASVGKRPFVGL
jgi:hypothetical protein